MYEELAEKTEQLIKIKKQKSIGTLAQKLEKKEKEITKLQNQLNKKEKELQNLKEELKSLL